MTAQSIQRSVLSLISLLALAAIVIVVIGFSSFPGTRGKLEETCPDTTDRVSSQTISPVGSRYHPIGTAQPLFQEPFCSQCHPVPPHQGSGSHQAILNHHTSRIHCLVCHGQEYISSIEDLSWKDGLLWLMADKQWLTAAVEERWREKATRKSSCFQVGPQCMSCHLSGGLLDYEALGYEKERIDDLQNLNKFITASKDQKWFFPAIR